MRAKVLVGLLVVSTVAAFPVRAQSAVQCMTPPEACAFLNTFLSALNQRNWPAFRATLADDISVVFDSPALPGRRDGRAAVEEAFARIFPSPDQPATQLPPPVQPENLLVQDFGDVVIISFQLTGPDSVSRRTLVFHRSPIGWRVVHIHGSSVARPAR